MGRRHFIPSLRSLSPTAPPLIHLVPVVDYLLRYTYIAFPIHKEAVKYGMDVITESESELYRIVTGTPDSDNLNFN
jgi:hypothetical protein